MTAETPESGTLRQELREKIDEWRDDADECLHPSYAELYREKADEIEELL